MCEYCEPSQRPKRWEGVDVQMPYSTNKHDRVQWGIYGTDGDKRLNISGFHETYLDDYQTMWENVVLNIPINNCPNCGRKL